MNPIFQIHGNIPLKWTISLQIISTKSARNTHVCCVFHSLLFGPIHLRKPFSWNQHKCYIVATCDRDLKRRIRKVKLLIIYLSFMVLILDHITMTYEAWTGFLCCRFLVCQLCTSPDLRSMNWVSVLQIPGVPIMYITKRKYSIERLPEATIGGGRYSELYNDIYSLKSLTSNSSLIWLD